MDYKALQSHLIEVGGGEKHVPLRILLDFLQQRVNVLNNEIGTPHIDIGATQFSRGCRWEILALIQALKEGS